MDTAFRNTSAKKTKRLVLSFALLLLSISAFAQESTAKAATSSAFSNPLFLTLLSIIILLVIVIIVFADVIKAAAQNKVEQDKKKKENSNGLKCVVALIVFGVSANSVKAQEVVSVSHSANSYMGLNSFTFYLMLIIIAFEVFIIWMLYKMSMDLLGVEERRAKKAEEKAKMAIKEPSIIEKLNASVAIEKEEEIMTDHVYDGIRELDNNLPPWWKYGFYLTIVWSVIYMVHYHISNTGKLQTAEYEDQLLQAKIQMDEYRKKAANLVDENNATTLIDDASLISGKNLFMDNCAACHGRAGEGGVGPNLTDDYWLHSGGIKDIFKTIKYGYPEKGMKAWQQDLGAKQIHEVSSYIKSIYGTNPPNAKEKQGDLYKESGSSDSTKIAAGDSAQIVK
ncbi:MAG: hypothetical protein K0Q95_3064 [Bacteroidota bacterium]|jgi:cytochrome c oxidase cbb3-type subunit 3|nr:hypothetical protein [Bacteroidota bacterium]